MTDWIAEVKEIVELLRSAEAALDSADHIARNMDNWPTSEEPQVLKERLHVASHELGTDLAFQIRDIDALIARAQIRAHCAQYSDLQFRQIIREGWSLKLVRELHDAIPEISLESHSSAIRSIHAQVSALPRVARYANLDSH